MASRIPPVRPARRGAALAFPVCAGRHSNHDNGCRRDRNRCLSDGRLLLRPVAALRGQPEVREDAGRRCGEGCMEGTQEPAADRSCHRGRVLPVEPPGALTRITVRSSCRWAGWPLGEVARAGLAMMRVPAARPGAPQRPSGEHAPLVNVPADRADDGELREILRARTTAPRAAAPGDRGAPRTAPAPARRERCGDRRRPRPPPRVREHARGRAGPVTIDLRADRRSTECGRRPGQRPRE